MSIAKLIESIRYAAGHGQAVLLSPEDGLALTDEIARLTHERDEARAEQVAIVRELLDIIESRKPRTRPTEPTVVVVRREVGDE